MNKSMVCAALMLSIFSLGMLKAASSEFRSPLSLQRGVMHYPLSSVDEAWWYDAIPSDRKESKWHIYSLKGAYYRFASKSFFDSCNPCNNKTTRKKVSLSTLWFGKEAFRGEEAFAGGIVEDPTIFGFENVFLGFSRIMPRFDYNEYGAYFGIDASRKVGDEEKWHVGTRVSLPFKVIEIERDQTCDKIYEDLDDVVRLRTEPNSFAARGDFIRSLVKSDGSPITSAFSASTAGPIEKGGFAPGGGGQKGGIVPFLNFSNISVSPQVQKGGRLTTHAVCPLQPGNSFTPPSIGSPPGPGNGGGGGGGSSSTVPDEAVALLGKEIGCVPAAPYCVPQGTAATSLPLDGSLGDGSLAFMVDTVDYSKGYGKDRDQQGKSWFVPVCDGDGPVGASADFWSDLNKVLPELRIGGTQNPLDFFRKRCIDLCAAERIIGQGDLDTEVYGGYVEENWFVDGVLGVRVPTGRRDRDPRRVFFKATGNNGHFEVKIGVDAGWEVRDWFALKCDWAFHHVFNRTERRAVPLKGALIRNIGPDIDAKISWDYFTGHIDFNFFHPYNPEIGCVVGYEIFAKRKDRVCIDCNRARDFFGRQTDVDESILRNRTNTMTHKIRGQVFHRWNFFELLAGGSHVFAGRNAMQESELHVGLAVYF